MEVSVKYRYTIKGTIKMEVDEKFAILNGEHDVYAEANAQEVGNIYRKMAHLEEELLEKAEKELESKSIRFDEVTDIRDENFHSLVYLE